MDLQQMACPSCGGIVVVNFSVFPLNRVNRQKFAVKCPLCDGVFQFGYVAEAYVEANQAPRPMRILPPRGP